MACRVYETYIPDELIGAHILPHLPAKSIGRLRCVSKPWRSLLSSPEFIKSHLKHQKNKPADLLLERPNVVYMINFGNRNDSVSKVSHPYDSDRPETHLGPSCHGLILLKLRTKSKFLHDYRYTYEWSDHLILINPITKESLKVLADAGKGIIYGLGYDRVTDDYKIISISVDGKITGSLYSVKLNTQRELSNPGFPRDLCYINGHGVFLDGYIYFIGLEKNATGHSQSFFAFNLALEEFEQLPLPSGFQDVDCPYKITVFEGLIALAVGPGMDYLLDVWVMKEYGVQDSWTNVLTIPKPKSFRVTRGIDHACLLSRDEMVLYTKGLFKYNWMNEDRRNVVDLPVRTPQTDQRWLNPFRGSLLSPRSLEGTQNSSVD